MPAAPALPFLPPQLNRRVLAMGPLPAAPLAGH